MTSQVDKNWTPEEAEEAQRQAERSGALAVEDGPLLQWVALRGLDDLEAVYTGGDRDVLMPAIALCARHDLALPKWVRRAYLEGYDAVNSYRAASWDEVFGKPHRKGTHLQSAREGSQKRLSILLRVNDIRKQDPGTAIDAALFERIGSEHHVSPGRAKKLYYEAKRLFPRIG